MPDVVVIGAGPAGCVAALLLARRGLRVTIVEQHRFPRDKVCGECVSALGAQVLRELDLGDGIERAGAVRLGRTALHAPDGRSAVLDLPEPMWAISRGRFDALLLDAVVRAGVNLRQPARCEAINAGIPPRVTVRDLASNLMSELLPRYVLLADGKSMLCPQRPPNTGDFGLKAHFTGVAGLGDAVELFGASSHYGGVAPIESGLWNVAFSVPRKRLAARPDLDRLFDQICSENKTLRRYFRSTRRASDWLTSPLPRFPMREVWDEGIVPVGNAACAIEPIGGEGMGLAMKSGQLAAIAIADAIDRGERLDTHALRESFVRLWATRAPACRAAAWWVSRPRLCSIAAELMRASSLSGILLGALGKQETLGDRVPARRDSSQAGTVCWGRPQRSC